MKKKCFNCGKEYKKEMRFVKVTGKVFLCEDCFFELTRGEVSDIMHLRNG